MGDSSGPEGPRDLLGKSARGNDVLGAAAVAGIAGDALLRAGPPGVNVALWAAVLIALVLYIRRGRPVISRGDDAVGAAALLLFAAGFAWRTAPLLMLLNFFALGVVVSLAALRLPVAKLAASGLWDYLKGALIGAFHVFLGPVFLVFKDVEWKQAPARGRVRLLSALRGVALGLPLLIVFGSLLMGADAIFDHLIRKTFHLNLFNLFTHAFLILFLAWIVGGFLRGTFFSDPESFAPPARPARLGLGSTETAVALGLLDALFLVFVWVQFRYFFGGAERVLVTPGLTYAEYARRGFFELSAVAALVLPLLLGAHWLLRKEKPGDESAYRWVAGVMLLMVFVIMVSALQRMRLYQAEYGMTVLRFCTTAFMIWLAAVFAWFALTVLRGRRRRFAFGAMMAGFAAILALEALNPDALIARVNIERAAQGKKFDARYLRGLSTDAVPAIVRGLPRLPPPDRSLLAAALLERWGASKNFDWRTWNYSRDRARKAVSQAVPQLEKWRASVPGANAESPAATP